MDELRKGLLLLIKSAITGEKYALPDNLDYQKICLEAKAYGFATFVYYGAYNSGINVNSQPFLALLPLVYKGIRINEKQLFELENIENAFCANKILAPVFSLTSFSICKLWMSKRSSITYAGVFTLSTNDVVSYIKIFHS